MHPRLFADLADLEVAASHRAAEARRTRRRLRRARRADHAPRRTGSRTASPRPADTRPPR